MPHNAYNVFFKLERFMIVDMMMDASSSESESNEQHKSYDLDGYESLVLPDLPPRYQHMQLPMGWFVPGKNSKRKHSKSHRNGKLDVYWYLDFIITFILSLLNMHHLTGLHFTAVTPYAELAQIVVANWKIIDKETKEYCMIVSNLIQERHSRLNKQGARDGQSKKKKAQLVQQRVVSSPKEPYVVTAKANRDTKPPIVHYTTSTVDKLAVSSNVMPSSKASMAMNTQGTFNNSTSPDAMNEMCCLPFSTDSPNVLSTSSHRQEVDVPNNSGNQSYTTDSDSSVMFVSAVDDVDSPPREDVEQEKTMMWARSVQLQAAEACLFQNYMFQMTTSDVSSLQRATVSAPSSYSDVSSLKDGTTPWPEDEMIPVIANINRRASIAADITRANLLAIAADERANNVMAWTKCKEEKVSSPTTMKIKSPPLSYTLPLCQPVSEKEPSVGMILCRPTFDSSHQRPSVDDDIVQRSKSKESTYDIEGLSDVDSVLFGMW
jgi:hypothetical protein